MDLHVVCTGVTHTWIGHGGSLVDGVIKNGSTLHSGCDNTQRVSAGLRASLCRADTSVTAAVN